MATHHSHTNCSDPKQFHRLKLHVIRLDVYIMFFVSTKLLMNYTTKSHCPLSSYVGRMLSGIIGSPRLFDIA